MRRRESGLIPTGMINFDLADGTVVEYRDDEWSAAMGAMLGLNGPRDLGPLAVLLKRGLPVPGDVGAFIGRMLAPPWGEMGAHLKLVVPPRRDTAVALKELGDKRALGLEMMACYDPKKRNKKRVIGSFADSSKNTEGYLRDCWALADGKTAVLQAERIMSDGVRRKTARKR